MAKTGSLSDANFPVDADGHVYHLGVKRGQLANRIVTVGDPRRAELLSEMLDSDSPVFKHTSNRGFHTFTGRFNGVPVSVIAIGMGVAAMDFFVREAEHIIDAPMAVLRLGTCGSPHTDVDIGMVVLASSAAGIARDCDAILTAHAEGKPASAEQCYRFTRPQPMHPGMVAVAQKHLQQALGDNMVFTGLNVSADTFYGSQGRRTAFFDCNADMFEVLARKYDGHVAAVEMESYTLAHLAACSPTPIAAAACAIVLANRNSNAFLDNDTIKSRERSAGRACLAAVAEITLEDSEWQESADGVWNS